VRFPTAVLLAARLAHPLRLYLPLLVVGALAGLLYTLSRRAADPRRRILYQLAWILVLLAGGPLWLFTAAAMGWI
jgi:hypothetical protein